MRLETRKEGFAGKLGRYWGILCDFLILGLLCGLISLPVITAGAAGTAALEYGIRRLRERESSLFQEFFTSFKTHFKQATLLWLPLLLAAMLVGGNLIFYYSATAGFLRTAGLAFCIAAAVLVLLLGETGFACLLFFPDRLGLLIKKSLWLGLRHIGWFLLSLAGKAGVLAAALFVPVLWIAVPDVMLLIHCLCLRAAFRRYDRAESDEDPSALNE